MNNKSQIITFFFTLTSILPAFLLAQTKTINTSQYSQQTNPVKKNMLQHTPLCCDSIPWNFGQMNSAQELTGQWSTQFNNQNLYNTLNLTISSVNMNISTMTADFKYQFFRGNNFIFSDIAISKSNSLNFFKSETHQFLFKFTILKNVYFQNSNTNSQHIKENDLYIIHLDIYSKESLQLLKSIEFYKTNDL